MKNTIELCGIDYVAKPNAKNVVKEILGEIVNAVDKMSSDEQKPASTRKKFPRLNELYGKLFDTLLPGDMHNSIVDVLVCLRCFLKVRGVTEMPENAFLELVEKHSRPTSSDA